MQRFLFNDEKIYGEVRIRITILLPLNFATDYKMPYTNYNAVNADAA